MPRCTKEVEIELKDGKVVDTLIEVNGIWDQEFGADADGNRAQGQWLRESWSHEHNETLTEDEESELNERVEEIVFEEEWDFASAADDESSNEDLE